MIRGQYSGGGDTHELVKQHAWAQDSRVVVREREEVSIAGHELVGARFGGEGYEIVILAIA